MCLVDCLVYVESPLLQLVSLPPLRTSIEQLVGMLRLGAHHRAVVLGRAPTRHSATRGAHDTARHGERTTQSSCHEQLRQLRELFLRFDLDSDGSVTKLELAAPLVKLDENVATLAHHGCLLYIAKHRYMAPGLRRGLPCVLRS